MEEIDKIKKLLEEKEEFEIKFFCEKEKINIALMESLEDWYYSHENFFGSNLDQSSFQNEIEIYFREHLDIEITVKIKKEIMDEKTFDDLRTLMKDKHNLILSWFEVNSQNHLLYKFRMKDK